MSPFDEDDPYTKYARAKAGEILADATRKAAEMANRSAPPPVQTITVKADPINKLMALLILVAFVSGVSFSVMSIWLQSWQWGVTGVVALIIGGVLAAMWTDS